MTRFLIHVLVNSIVHLGWLLIASAQDGPSPLISGPTTARTGDIIILDASASKADFFDWLVDDSGVALPNDDAMKKAKAQARQLRAQGFEVKEPKAVTPTSYMILEGGKKLLLASYPGTWRVSLAVSNTKGVKQLPWKIIVVGNGPQPPPPDPGGPKIDPKPPVDPPLKTDFSLDTKVWLNTVPQSSRDLKDSKGRTVQQNFSESLKEIGNAWSKAGSIAAMETLLGVSIQATLTPLGAKAADWSSFAKSANTALDGLKAKGATPAQYGAALISIGRGLE